MSIPFTIRPVRAEDAQGLCALRSMAGIYENTLGLPSARLEQTQAFLAGLGPNDHQFVAVGEDGLVLGVAGLQVQANPRTRHVGGVGIYVHRDYQGKGIGTALLGTLLDLADNWLMLVRVELEVLADNEGAIRLYERLGFEKEGLKRKTTVRRGAYVDEYIMGRLRPEGKV